MNCPDRILKGAVLVFEHGLTFTAPAYMVAGANGGLTEEPNGDPLAFLSAEKGAVLGAGPVYHAPCRGMTDEPNGRPIFTAWPGSAFLADGTTDCAGATYCDQIPICK